ncbi:MAG: Ig-like domain-containing protein [Bacteroidaceae bacterium]|nr:Ig-like domain-containing protein [Bacteroidaceae bacterium]
MKKSLFTLAFALVTFTANAQVYSYDVNGDGIVNIVDVTCLVNKILEIDNPGETPQSYPFCTDDNHPHLIDLGLPSGTKWACCNVGANKPEAYGNYYAWGEVNTKAKYDWSTYIYCDGSQSTCHNLGNEIFGLSYDVAQKQWGGSWLMPTQEQIVELLNNCTHEWTTMNGVPGVKFSSKTNSGFIFLPAAGLRYGSNSDKIGLEGNYWSSTQYSQNNYDANILCFDDALTYSSHSLRQYGASIRPIIATCESLQINTSELSLMIGDQGTVEINSGSSYYIVQSSNPSVATATLSGSTVTVTAVKDGKANITLTDRISRETATIEVSVRPISYTSCPDDHHPHLIDLGLPSGTKWACCNVEADQPYAYGGYYAWGEVDTKTYYDWNTYKHCDGTEETAHDIGLDISGTEYDVAHVKWGGLWVMPNINDFLELIDNCTQEWTTWNGINGKWFKSRNNEARIFFPAAWYYQKDDHIVDVAEGVYWSSSYYTPKPTDAYEFRFGTDFANETWGQIEFGKPVRPVVK